LGILCDGQVAVAIEIWREAGMGGAPVQLEMEKALSQ